MPSWADGKTFRPASEPVQSFLETRLLEPAGARQAPLQAPAQSRVGDSRGQPTQALAVRPDQLHAARAEQASALFGFRIDQTNETPADPFLDGTWPAVAGERAAVELVRLLRVVVQGSPPRAVEW